MERIDLIEAFEGLSPAEAKELTRRIKNAVETETQKFKQGESNMPLNLNEIFASLDDDEIKNVLEGMSTEEQVELYRSLAQKKTPPVGELSVEERLTRNSEKLRFMYKEPSKYRPRIAELELENEAMFPILDEHIKQAQENPNRDLQIQQLEGQREKVLEELGRYQKFPSKYRARMQELYKQQTEIDAKIQQVKA